MNASQITQLLFIMSAFFIKTDSSVVGPFSGVELRELAFAGIIKPESEISGSPGGAWQTAQAIGLFSDDRLPLPLPHPAGTVLSQFQVKGLPPAYQGPFKLRELVGFAARGMLPPDAIINVDRAEQWIQALRFRVLAMCMNGELVRLSSSGQLVLRAIGGSGTGVNLEGTRAPVEIAHEGAARRASMNAEISLASVIVDDGYEAEQASLRAAGEAARAAQNALPEVSKFARYFALFRSEIAIAGRLRNLTLPGWLVPLVIVILLIIGSAAAYTFFKQPTPRQQVIGDWIGYVGNSSEVGKPRFGVSLREDGTCVVFNSVGPSWTGKFTFIERCDAERIYEKYEEGNTVVDTIEMIHFRDQVQSTDGYIRFSGNEEGFPMIDGHPVQEAFVRPGRDQLQFGYLAIVNWMPSVRTLEAGWITANAAMPVMRVSTTQAATEESPTVVELLRTRGIPDEARKISPDEIAEPRKNSPLMNAQVARYGTEKFFVIRE